MVEHDELARFNAAPSCAPTYATSHRWNWPDERGVMRCACGAKTGVLDGLACVVHSPAIAIERMGFLSQEERNTIASNFLDEEQEHLQGRWRIALGLGWIDHVPAPTEQERCERLGVAWVGPEYWNTIYGPQIAIHDFPGRIIRERVAASGDLIRLGCELREADGVTAR